MEIQRLIIRIWCQIWPEFKCLTWLFCWVFLLPYMYLGKKLKSAYTCPYKIDWPSAWGRWWVSTDNKRSMPKVCVYIFRSDQIRLVAQSCLTLCNPMNRSTPILNGNLDIHITKSPPGSLHPITFLISCDDNYIFPVFLSQLS